MIKVRNIDHVAVAVPDLGPAAQPLASLFALRPGSPERVAGQGVDAQFLYAGAPSHAGTALELVAPGDNPSLQRFVAKRGSALHHVCFEVDDVAAALASLKAAGVPLVDEVPRPGARGHLVGFIHPSATGGVLFELCQHVTPGDKAP